MRVDVSFKYLESSKFIDNVLEKNIGKIERRLKIFRQDAPIHVSVHVEKNPHKEQYFCRTQAYLPTKVLISEENGRNASGAINKAFSAISKQLSKLKERIEHLRHKPRRNISKDEFKYL
ncbi:MAG: hypothetical protein GY858_00030 [Candidatus Omnitrophica bacterium]|nr:hypothetical protein [Candidatus Omnitrophota bacterium]